jgi:hypothetical protein
MISGAGAIYGFGAQLEAGTNDKVSFIAFQTGWI